MSHPFKNEAARQSSHRTWATGGRVKSGANWGAKIKAAVAAKPPKLSVILAKETANPRKIKLRKDMPEGLALHTPRKKRAPGIGPVKAQF